MACRPNEISILKAASAKLDADNLLVLAVMYHTASKEDKRNGAKSFYTLEGRIVKIDDLKTEIASMKLDANKLSPWKWPTKNPLWTDEYYLSYDGSATNARGAKWLQDRITKALSWTAFLDLAKNGVKQTARGPKTSDSAKYDLEDYVTEGGLQFSIDSVENMLKLGPTTFSKRIILKRDM